jgi:hypothetical protein
MMLLFYLTTVLAAQDIQVNPGRPTFSTPALTTQDGLVELESGVARQTARDESWLSSDPLLLKFGLTSTLDLRLAGSFQRLPDGKNWSDLTLTTQWNFTQNGFGGTQQAMQLSHKLATAAVGYGTNHQDTTVGYFVSKDLSESTHIDTNLLQSWLGSDTGTVKQTAVSISGTWSYTSSWSVAGEFYALSGNSLNGHVVDTLWAVAYKYSSRLVLDTGIDIGLTQSAPKYNLMLGCTYGFGFWKSHH